MNRKFAIILILIGIIGIVFYIIYFLKATEKPTPKEVGGGLFPQTNNNEGVVEISDILNNTKETSDIVSETTEVKEEDMETFALTDYRVSAGSIDSQTVSLLGVNDSNLPTKNSNLQIKTESYTEKTIPAANVIAFKDSAYNRYDLETKKLQTYSSDKAYGSYYAEIISPTKLFIQLWNTSTKKINSFLGDFTYNNRELATCNLDSELLASKYSPKNIESAQRILFNTYRDDDALFTPGLLDDITKKNIMQFQRDRSLKVTGQFDSPTKKGLSNLCKEQLQAILDTKLLNDNSKALGRTAFKKIQDSITDYLIKDKLLYTITPSGKDSLISVLNTDTYSLKTIAELPLHEWNIASAISPELLLVYQNPSKIVDGYLFLIDAKTNNFTPIIGPEKGLSAACDQVYCILSYVNTTDNSITSEIFNISTRERDILPFSTLADKCNFTSGTLFCGVPRNISNEAPDSWYQGIEHFNDIITEYNPLTKELVLLDNNMELDISTISKKIINNLEYYGYIDRKSGFYYITKKKIPIIEVPQPENITTPSTPPAKN